MFSKLIQKIEQYEIICVYRHTLPDGDANGSQFGIKTWIENRYPHKKVYALGIENQETFFPACWHETLDFENALAIVCDTANHQRIDNDSYARCKEIVKIDHHPVVDDYADFSIVNEKACATCEIISQMLMEANEPLTSVTATYLYCGLLTDSQRFSLPNVTQKTFEIAAYLSRFGIDIPLINQKMFSSNLIEYRFETYLRSKLKMIGNHLAYIIIEKEEYERFGLTFQKAKEKVFIMNHVNEFEIYCLFTEQPEGNFAGSLRSRNTKLNDIAALYHGGGHNFASGVKNLSRIQIDELLLLLEKRFNDEN